MFTIEFRFENSAPVKAYAHEGENLLEVARKNNVAIDAPCSGNASCGKCRVRLIGGTLKSEKTRHITEEEYDTLFCNPYQAAQRGYIEDVIEPNETRFRLIRALRSLTDKRQDLPAKKHDNLPL